MPAIKPLLRQIVPLDVGICPVVSIGTRSLVIVWAGRFLAVKGVCYSVINGGERGVNAVWT